MPDLVSTGGASFASPPVGSHPTSELITIMLRANENKRLVTMAGERSHPYHVGHV